MLNGNAVLTIWHDIEVSGQAAYTEWHTLEHMKERADIPGFVRGRRGVAVDPHQSPQYVTLYEADDAEVFRSPAYLARLDGPTPWTQRIQPSFLNFVRFANDVEEERGVGDGAFVTTARFEARGDSTVDAGRVETTLRRIVDELERLPLVASVALLHSRDEITDYETQEAGLRPANPELDGVRHVAVLCVDTVTQEAAARVRESIRGAEVGLEGVRIGHCATFLVDFVIDAAQTGGQSLSEDALDVRGRAVS